MRKIEQDVRQLVNKLAGDSSIARKSLYSAYVRDLYRQSIEAIYPPNTAKLHLAHTNNVFVKHDEGANELIVYVDERLFEVELHKCQSQIQAEMSKRLAETIDAFQIKTSRWEKHRKAHPFVVSN